MAGGDTARDAMGLTLVALFAGLAGMVDAIGLLLSQNFVSFMTGNTTRLATSLGNGNLDRVALLAAYLATFVLGNAVAYAVAARTERQWPNLLLVASGLAVSAALGVDSWTLLPTVFAMGALNPSMERAAGVALGLTYVTGALARLGKGIGGALVGRPIAGSWKSIVPWAGMIAGAVVGAYTGLALGEDALWPALVYALALAALAACLPRSWTRVYLDRA